MSRGPATVGRLRAALRTALKHAGDDAKPASAIQAGLHPVYGSALPTTASSEQAAHESLSHGWSQQAVKMLFGLAAASIACGAVAEAAEERLNPEVLQDLAHDLVKGQYADKERAVAMLSSMTMYIDHHEVLLEAGVLPSLMSAVSNPKVEPTVRVVALGCTADLFKSPEAQNFLATHPDFLQVLVQCMRGEDRWDSGPEEGGLAKSHAARLLSELAGYDKLHALMVRSGAAEALADRGEELARLSAKQDRHYSSLGAVPGNNLELQAVDEERFTAAALFGLAGSPQGLDVLLRHPGQVLTGMVNWAQSRDPILQRYGVGGVARAAISSGAGLAAVMDAGGLEALVAALSEDDPQAQCFAAAALGRVAARGGQASQALIQQGAPQGLLSMLQQSASQDKRGANVGSNSKGVRKGVYKCALRGLLAATQDQDMRAALQKSQGAATVQAFMSKISTEGDPDLADLANRLAQQLAA
ncbi:hypothetical protein ABBQ38_005150 [Trebouxia sp. C0009 RCD-2024]